MDDGRRRLGRCPGPGQCRRRNVRPLVHLHRDHPGEGCAVAALAQGGGAASLAGLAACLLGGWAAITLREVATCAES